MGTPTVKKNESDPVSFALAAPKCPVTYERKLALDADQFLEKPSIARANVAVSDEAPYGQSDYARKYSNYVSNMSSSGIEITTE
ncbi:hypothetical protein DL764_000466 [Monosporascus ibericus]|uniref:Uncharacterized protein n=1 Tax=Monosporascus ibericus TaxID=155417 RepID=A0A4Q4TYN3_9PEZI|nr:hypothetical protein DL764_000466 [Monosporascus ibericus]